MKTYFGMENPPVQIARFAIGDGTMGSGVVFEYVPTVDNFCLTRKPRLLTCYMRPENSSRPSRPTPNLSATTPKSLSTSASSTRLSLCTPLPYRSHRSSLQGTPLRIRPQPDLPANLRAVPHTRVRRAHGRQPRQLRRLGREAAPVPALALTPHAARRNTHNARRDRCAEARRKRRRGAMACAARPERARERDDRPVVRVLHLRRDDRLRV